MTAPWWQTAVVYQIYPRSFQDTTGNGVGDLRGIERRLDYLAGTLGIDAVWISPFYPSPMADFGYDVSDYCDVDPLYGSLADFDRLIAAAHDRGLRLIIDWVPNHTSDQHAWFLASRSSRDDPKRDWYTWADPKPDGGPPNNWQSVFGGPAWEWDEATDQYYLHSFLPDQPDLNWRNPQVRAAMFDTVRFWLDRGVDGLRIDVAHYVMKDPALRDNPPATGRGGAFKAMGEYDRQQHLYDQGHPDVHGVFRELRRLLDGYDGDRFAIGEIHVFDWTHWASYYGRANDELHMPFNFSLVWAPWDAAEFRRRIDALEAALPPDAWPNYVLGNHDEARLASRYGPAAPRAAAMLLLTLRGTPTIYYGDELGFPQVDIPPERQQDPWGRTVPALGRDGCRTPMQWTPAPGHGFSTAGPWLPFTPDAATRNVASQQGDPGSMLELYRRLLAYRRASPALRLGEYRPVDPMPDGIFAYTRHHAGEVVLVALNFTGDTVAVDLGPGRTVITTAVPETGDRRRELQPFEGVIVERDRA